MVGGFQKKSGLGYPSSKPVSFASSRRFPQPGLSPGTRTPYFHASAQLTVHIPMALADLQQSAAAAVTGQGMKTTNGKVVHVSRLDSLRAGVIFLAICFILRKRPVSVVAMTCLLSHHADAICMPVNGYRVEPS